MSTDTLAAPAATTDTFPINGTDYVEFYVGNAKQASHYYRSAFGFELLGYRGPETGVRDRASYLLQQDKIRLVLTTAVRPDHPAAHHLHAHGDTIHSLVERRGYKGLFMPGFRRAESPYRPASVGLKYVDHIVGNVELGRMNEWVGFYERVMGFKNLISFDDTDISTEYSSLMSKVVSSGNERIKFPINEPAKGKKKSQIDEYLEFYGGPGAQHLALATDDIIATVTALRDRGVEFLSVPTTYYDDLQKRVGVIDEPVGELAALGILVDRDPD